MRLAKSFILIGQRGNAVPQLTLTKIRSHVFLPFVTNQNNIETKDGGEGVKRVWRGRPWPLSWVSPPPIED